MGNTQKQYGVFIGEKNPGETRILRSGYTKDLIKDYNGVGSLAEAFK